MDIWQRIHRAINFTLSMHDRIDIRSSMESYPFTVLKEIFQVLKTNHIPLFDPEDFEPEIMEHLPGNTRCPGLSFISILFGSSD